MGRYDEASNTRLATWLAAAAVGLLLTVAGSAHAQSNSSSPPADDEAFSFEESWGPGSGSSPRSAQHPGPPIGLPIRRHLIVELLQTDRALPE